MSGTEMDALALFLKQEGTFCFIQTSISSFSRLKWKDGFADMDDKTKETKARTRTHQYIHHMQVHGDDVGDGADEVLLHAVEDEHSEVGA